jgi:hypothetical protein
MMILEEEEKKRESKRGISENYRVTLAFLEV